MAIFTTGDSRILLRDTLRLLLEVLFLRYDNGNDNDDTSDDRQEESSDNEGDK